jgi:peroxiredoxin
MIFPFSPNKIIFAVFLVLISAISFSQVTSLEGLHAALPGEIDHSQPMMIDGVTTPVFSPEGVKIAPEQLGKYFSSGELTLEPYCNDKKEVKAFVFRKLSEEEKKMMGGMMKMPVDEITEEEKAHPIDGVLTDLKGNKVKISDFKGKVVVINFWFIACKPCTMEMPELNHVVTEFNGKDVVFLGIALDEAKDLKKFLKAHAFDYRIFASGDQFANEMGVMSFPTHFVIGRDGILQFKTSGFSPTTIPTLKEAINAALK